MLADLLSKERIEESKTIVVKTIFPSTTNHYDTLFGGMALQWMDEVAFITATRFARKKFATVSLDKTNFKIPIPVASFIELVGLVVDAGTSSIKVRVDVYLEPMYENTKKIAISGIFSLVVID